MSEEKDKDQDMQLVDKAIEQLLEHFDSVHVFVTRHEAYEQDGTVNISYGKGNWFTRYGQINEWLVKQNEIARGQARDRS